MSDWRQCGLQRRSGDERHHIRLIGGVCATLRSLLRPRAWRRMLGLEYHPRIQHGCAWEWLGSDYGGYPICLEPLERGSIVYSLGVGEDISFDVAVLEKFGADVFAFDPTPRAAEWVGRHAPPDGFHFYPYGIAGHDGEAVFYPPEDPKHVSHTILPRPNTSNRSISVEVKRLSTVMRELGHTRIDVLKMDIEGAEFEVIDDLLAHAVRVDQLLAEFHGRFSGAGRSRTQRAVKALNRHGYQIFAVRGDVVSLLRTGW